MRLSAYVAVLVLCWSAFAHSGRAGGQKTTHVVIEVTDPSGAVIPSAEVWIGRVSDSLKPFIITNDRGVLAADVEPGKYDIDAQFPGFRVQKQQLTVLERTEQRVNIRLQVGGCSPCVAVEKMPAPTPAVPLPSPTINEVPAECYRRRDMLDEGFPVFSKTGSGVRYGISLPQNHVVSPFPVPLYIWIDNRNVRDISVFSACDLIQKAAIHLKFIPGRGVSKRESSSRSQLCSAQVPMRVPAHTCFAFAKVDLTDIYELHSGVYSVAAGKQDKERRRSAEQQDSLFFQYQVLAPTR